MDLSWWHHKIWRLSVFQSPRNPQVVDDLLSNFQIQHHPTVPTCTIPCLAQGTCSSSHGIRCGKNPWKNLKRGSWWSTLVKGKNLESVDLRRVLLRFFVYFCSFFYFCLLNPQRELPARDALRLWDLWNELALLKGCYLRCPWHKSAYHPSFWHKVACSDENLVFTNQLPSHVSVLTTKPSQYLRQLTSHAQLWSQWMHWNAWTRTNTSRVVAFLLEKKILRWPMRYIEMLITNKTCSLFHKLLTEPAALLSLSRLLTCHAAVGSDDFKRR